MWLTYYHLVTSHQTRDEKLFSREVINIVDDSRITQMITFFFCVY